MKKFKSILAMLLCCCMLLSAGVYATERKTGNQAASDGTVYVYLTRHGKTLSNQTARLVSGRGNTPLTEAGREVAFSVGVGLSTIPFQAAYSSPLGRTQETARIILAQSQTSRDLDLVPVEGLREVDNGSFEPMGYGELMEKHGMKFADTNVKDFTNQFHDKDKKGLAESYDEMRTRVMDSFHKICEDTAQNGGGNILVVAHGGVNGLIAAEILGTQKLDPLDNSSIVLIEYKDGKYSVKSFNDLSYAEKARAQMASPKPVEVYFTVHAETVADADGRLNGQLDTDLTKTGQDRAAALGRQLGKTEFRAVYASDQFKDIDTARIIMDNGLNPHLMINTDMALRGVSCGYFDGELKTVAAALAGKMPTAKERLAAYAAADKTGTTESYNDAKERLTKALTDLCKETYARGGGNVLVVSSELSAQLLAESFGTGKAVGPLGNGTVLRLTYDGSGFAVQYLDKK